MNPFRFVSTILGYLKQQPAAIVAASPTHTGVNMILLLAYLVWNNTKDKKKTRFRHKKSEIFCTCSETNSTRAKTASGSECTVEETPSPRSLSIGREESSIHLLLPAPEPEKISHSYYYDMEADDENGPTMLQCQMVRIVDPPRNNRYQLHQYSIHSTSTSYSTESEQPKSVKKGKKKNNKRLQKAYAGVRRNKRSQS